MKQLLRLTTGTVMLAVCSALQATAGAAPPVSCTSLSAVLSDDKDSYVFTAVGAAAQPSHITGYRFDFGDHESYAYMFNPSATQDHTQVTVDHTYQQAGRYHASVTILTDNGEVAPGTACSTDITNGLSPPNVLVDTGPEHMPAFIGGVIITGATVSYVYHYRRLRTGSR
jgi:PKD domain